MFAKRFPLVVALGALLLGGCGAPKNATIGTWAGTSAELRPGARPEPYKLAIDEKNATLYDRTGSAVGSYPVTFPNSNEAVITSFLGAVDVTAQPDGTVKVVGLNSSSTPGGQAQRSSDIFHRVQP